MPAPWRQGESTAACHRAFVRFPFIELFAFSADPSYARRVVDAGATGVVVDWERRGKRQRQIGADTQVNGDTPAQLAAVRDATPGRVLCRVNGWGDWAPAEIDLAVALGADEVLLPMVRRPEEVDAALEVVAGRCGLGILIETTDAVRRAEELLSRPVSRVYVGMNDLMIDRGRVCLFEALVDGTVDHLSAVAAGHGVPFGVAGLTVPEGGHPIPCRLLAAALADAAASFTFLRRSFHADTAERDPRGGGATNTGCRRHRPPPPPRPGRRRPSRAGRDGCVPQRGSRRMKALVTGAGGFVGAHLVARLVADGWEVVGTTRPGSPPWRLEALGVDDAVEVVEVDLACGDATGEATRAADPDVAFLLAAARSSATEAEKATTAAVNGFSAQWLVEAVGDRCRAVVRLGSSTEYGDTPGPMDEHTPVRPRGFFGVTKAAGSRLVVAAAARRGVRSAVLRAFQVYGPLDHPTRLVPSALRAARLGHPLPLTGPGLCRDWVFVDDVVDACVRAARTDDLRPGQVLNIGTGRQVANEALVAEVARVSGRPIAVDTGIHPGRDWDSESWLCDPTLAGELLGWKAEVDLAEGLARCWTAASS